MAGVLWPRGWVAADLWLVSRAAAIPGCLNNHLSGSLAVSASNLRIARLEDSGDSDWDQLVASSPQGNSFLRSDWLRMLARTDTSIRVERYVVWDQRDRLRGGWALPLRQHFGLRFATEYDLFYAGPMLAPDLTPPACSRRGEHDAVLSQLAQAFGRYCAVIAAEAHPSLSDVRVFLDAGWSVALQLREDMQHSEAIRLINLGGSPQQSLARFKDYLGATPRLHFRLIHRQTSRRLRLWEAQLQARAVARRWRGRYRKLLAG